MPDRRGIRSAVFAAAVAAGAVVAAVVGSSASGSGSPTLSPDASFNGGNAVLLDFPPPAGASGSPFVTATAVARQGDGKVVVGGLNAATVNTPSPHTESKFDVARLNASGSLDSGFGVGGYASVSPTANADNEVLGLAIQSDGKIVVAGTDQPAAQAPKTALARFTTGGTPDPMFGSGGTFVDSASSDFALALALDSSDRALTTGKGGDVHRYTSGGAVDGAFGSSGVSPSKMATGRAIAVQPDGKIVIAGFTGNAPNRHAIVARFNSDGSVDNGFGTSGATDITPSGSDEFLNAVALQGSSIVVGGTVNGGGGNLLARLDSGGHPDGTFGTGGRVVDTGAGAGAINALLYVPQPQIVSGGKDAADHGSVCQSDPTSGSRIGCSPASSGSSNGSVNAETQSCGPGTCTVDAAGSNATNSQGAVSQKVASDESTTPTQSTSSTTSTTSTQSTPPGTTTATSTSPASQQVADLAVQGFVSRPQLYGPGYPQDAHGAFEVPDLLFSPGRPTIEFVVRNNGPDPSPGGSATFTLAGFPTPPEIHEHYLCIDPLSPGNPAQCTVKPMNPSSAGGAEVVLPGPPDKLTQGTYVVSASVTGGINDPTVPDGAAVTAVVYRQQVAKQARQRASQPAKSLNGFRGVANTAASRAAHLRASDPSSSDGVAKRVQIALLRLTPGVRAARRRAGTCSWLAAPTARFRARRATKGVCDKQVWLTAIGTAHWRYRLRRHLPPGRYVLYSRVIDAVGNATEGFSARLGNRQAFRLT